MIGDILHLIRKEKKKTGQQFSEILDISIGTVWSIESNKTLPSIEALQKCASYVGTSVSEIYKISEYQDILLNKKNSYEQTLSIITPYIKQATNHDDVNEVPLCSHAK